MAKNEWIYAKSEWTATHQALYEESLRDPELDAWFNDQARRRKHEQRAAEAEALAAEHVRLYKSRWRR